MSESAPQVVIETTLGSITLELFAKDTPAHGGKFPFLREVRSLCQHDFSQSHSRIHDSGRRTDC